MSKYWRSALDSPFESKEESESEMVPLSAIVTLKNMVSDLEQNLPRMIRNQNNPMKALKPEKF